MFQGAKCFNAHQLYTTDVQNTQYSRNSYNMIFYIARIKGHAPLMVTFKNELSGAVV